MAFGKKAKAASTYMKSLNGEIILIRGNHDKPSDSIGYQIIDCGNYKFLLCHYPEREELPLPWEGWIIHGHKHNNDLKQYPFINGERKTINVSVEVINYKPLKMSYLLSLELFGIKYLETVNHHAINW
ncbi:MAG: hypothetical protein NTV31_04935 [Bacteroidia bacterium]|nr:hypothetical protein [Bacteroidia bacterium]